MSAFVNKTAELTDEETKREPHNYKEAISSPDCDLWKDAMWSEFCKVIAATEYKACICVQGFTQIPGIDFSDMYAPTPFYGCHS